MKITKEHIKDKIKTKHKLLSDNKLIVKNENPDIQKH